MAIFKNWQNFAIGRLVCLRLYGNYCQI